MSKMKSLLFWAGLLAVGLVAAVWVQAGPHVINIGSAANDGTGDPARTAFSKINSNFTEIYGLASNGVPANTFWIQTTNGTWRSNLFGAEVPSVPTPATNTLSLYVKDKSGVTALYFKNDVGTETEVGSGGAGSGQFYNFNASQFQTNTATPVVVWIPEGALFTNTVFKGLTNHGLTVLTGLLSGGSLTNLGVFRQGGAAFLSNNLTVLGASDLQSAATISGDPLTIADDVRVFLQGPEVSTTMHAETNYFIFTIGDGSPNGEMRKISPSNTVDHLEQHLWNFAQTVTGSNGFTSVSLTAPGYFRWNGTNGKYFQAEAHKDQGSNVVWQLPDNAIAGVLYTVSVSGNTNRLTNTSGFGTPGQVLTATSSGVAFSNAAPTGITVQTNGVNLGTGITTVNWGNSTVTGNVAGATANLGVSVQGGGGGSGVPQIVTNSYVSGGTNFSIDATALTNDCIVRITLTQDSGLLFTNAYDGKRFRLEVAEDSAGKWRLALNTNILNNWRLSQEITGPNVYTNANHITAMALIVRGTNGWLAGNLTGFAP